MVLNGTGVAGAVVILAFSSGAKLSVGNRPTIDSNGNWSQAPQQRRPGWQRQ